MGRGRQKGKNWDNCNRITKKDVKLKNESYKFNKIIVF